MIFFCKKIYEICNEKGRMAVGFIIMGILLWIGFEATGIVTGVILCAVIGIDPETNQAGMFGLILGGAVAGILCAVGLTFMVVGMLPHRRAVPQYGPRAGTPGPYQPSSNPYAAPRAPGAAGPYQYVGPSQPMPKGMNTGGVRVLKCPFCQMMITPMPDGACPSCRNRVA